MSPISSLPTFADPQLRALPLPKALPQAAGPAAIPLTDMRELQQPVKIGGGFAPPTLDQVPTGSGTLDKTLGRLVGEVNQKQTTAADTVRGLLNGENVQLHQAVLAMEEASVSFQLMVEVRNKLLESYQELMRMQI
jgi:flagellar hook-basal body complex protein FliE